MPLYQIYNEQGEPVKGEAASLDDVLTKHILHGASHVWIYRVRGGKKEVLLQKRASTKQTFPNKLDISAAGHIDLGESPLVAALREIEEEIGIKVKSEELNLFAVLRTFKNTSNNQAENEFCWIYLLNLNDEINFKLQKDEVESLAWVDFDQLKEDLSSNNIGKYVPQGDKYYNLVLDAIRSS